jgi:iron complex outermembrane receptor protein
LRASARALLLVGASISAAAVSNPAIAQNAAGSADDATDPNEIIVTAQFREQNLQDTPLAITAVNAETMEAKSQTNLAQVADSAPNVTLKPQGASFGPSISVAIRGIGASDFNPAFEPGVGIYIDDVYYPQLTGAVFDLLDLDRVEILRGPQGTLSGRNSEGGAIKMFTKKPSGENGGFVEGTYGSDQRIGVRAGVDFALTENLFGRISGVYKHQNGYVDRLDFGCVFPAGGPATFVDNDGNTIQTNPTGGIPRIQPEGACRVDRLGEVGYQAIRGALRYNPTDALDINLTAEYIHDKRKPAGEVLNVVEPISNPNFNVNGIPYDERFICGRFCNFATYTTPAITYVGVATPPGGQPILATDFDNTSVYDAYNLAANVHFELSDMFTIDNILAYQSWDSTFGVDDDLSPIPLNNGFNSLTHWNWSEELRLSARLADTATLVLGGYYFEQQTNYYSYQDIRYLQVAPGVGLFPLQFIQPDETPAEAKAVFGNINWEIIPGLTFDGGVRYTEESKEYHYFRLNPDGTVNGYLDPVGAANGAGTPGALTGLVATYKGNRWDWRAALNYRFSDAAMIYASYSTGFKGGGTNPRPFFASQAIGFNPEVLTSYEVGIKTDLFDRKLRLNVVGFYGELKDAQVGVSVCPDGTTPCAALINGGDAEQKGFEVEMLARPVEGLSIDGSLSYLEFKYTNLAPGTSLTLDTPLVGSPPWKWTLGAQYEIPLGSAGSLTPRVDASYQDDIYTGFDFEDEPVSIKAYTMVNGRITWRNADDDLSVALEVTNLTDKYYYLSLFDLRGAGAGLSKAQPGRPREWAVTLKKTF